MYFFCSQHEYKKIVLADDVKTVFVFTSLKNYSIVRLFLYSHLPLQKNQNCTNYTLFVFVVTAKRIITQHMHLPRLSLKKNRTYDCFVLPFTAKKIPRVSNECFFWPIATSDFVHAFETCKMVGVMLPFYP